MIDDDPLLMSIFIFSPPPLFPSFPPLFSLHFPPPPLSLLVRCLSYAELRLTRDVLIGIYVVL